ncbi:hypothetical protein [Aquimarina algicola]|uniref:hypothetical protein n=1 Tax=Aquimarina algicola TaxID=2589995 RepID=UPI001CF48AF4|nr:hypothetical protein [Aquimarina algicola]
MEEVIKILEEEKKHINNKVRANNLMKEDMKKAVAELSKITQIKKAIKILKLKKYT